MDFTEICCEDETETNNDRVHCWTLWCISICAVVGFFFIERMTVANATHIMLIISPESYVSLCNGYGEVPRSIHDPEACYANCGVRVFLSPYRKCLG